MAATELESNPIITDEYYANALVRFIPTESGDDTYKIQFGGDRWLTATDQRQGGYLWADWTLGFENLTEFNIYAIDKEANPAAFGINVAPYSWRVDNSGNGGLITLWETGKQDNVAYNNGIWNIVSVELTDASLKDIAYQNLKHTYNEYISYYDSFTSGILPGQYGIDEVAAFRAALDKVAELEISGIDEITTEELEHLAEQIEETYEAVINSRVELSMPNGYYRIKTGLDYEDGEDKYMYVADEGGTLNGMWGSVAKLDSHAPSLWKLTERGNSTFELKNVAFDAQFNQSTGTSAPFTLQTDSRELLYIIPSAYEDDRIYMNMRVATQTGEYVWIHQAKHSNGAGTGGNLVAWSASDLSGDRVLGSEWLFVPVSDEDAQDIIDAYAPIKDRMAMLAAYDSIMTNAKANLEIARDLQKIVHNEEGEELITSDDQFSSPYTETSEGSITGTLLDNSTAVESFWHSSWSGGTVAMDVHYLQVELTDTDIEAAVAVIGRRSNASNDHVTAMNVRGTNDPDAEKADCELLGNIKTPFGARGEMGVVSDVFEVKGYKYLRFYPTTTQSEGGGIDNRGYFHLAEFQLYPAELYQSEDALCFKLGELFTNLEELVNEYEGLEREDIKEEHYNILKAAYDAFMEGFENEIMKNEAYQNLLKVYDTYYVYYDAFTAGMNSGRYSEAKVAAFRIALDAVTALDGNLKGLTVDDLNRMGEHIRETYEAALKGTDAWNSAYRNLMEVYDTYYVYYNSFTPGTNPGNYGETEVIAFRAALDDVAGLGAPDANLDGFTVEDLNRMGVRIKEAYEAVMDSYINAPLSTPVISRGTNNTIRISGSEGTDSENPPTYYYTLNGTTPTTSSSRYLGPVMVTRNLTVKAIATREGYPQSDVAEFSVDWFKVAMPTFEPADNICTISCPTADATIYYTLDGTVPTEKSTRYTSPITVTKNLTLKAIAVHDGYNPSDVAELVVDWFQVAKPSFAQQGNQLSISCATEQATIYYTIGGSKEQVYNSAITLSDQSTVTAVGRREGYRDSETATYRPGLVKSATPVVTYNGREVRLENEEEGVHIYYTLDGTSPIDGEKKSNTAMEYFGVFNVDTLCLLRAVSVTDMTNVSDELTYRIDYLFDGTTAYVGQGGLLEKAFEWCGGMNVIDDRLTVSGPLNDAELRTISKLPTLEYLDLGKATLTSGRMPNELFRGTGLVSFVSPYGFSDTGGRLFADCPKLAAVIWNVNVALDANSFDGVDNPNLLLYVKDKKYAPASVTNVVIDGMAEHIVLTDKESGNNDFYCPKPFFAENISYTHDYRMQTKEGTTCGWETIALPFTVQSVTHEKTERFSLSLQKAMVSLSGYWNFRRAVLRQPRRLKPIIPISSVCLIVPIMLRITGRAAL